ncbi:fumarate hydratase C-terminal domain-containing protein [Tissierella sp. MSJ-40]|uniref:Fumarate hydratase C-terminal domain-containing protein n=1 Tax=Tissierella simiarum TaxID=2841534 RepID=A0ABS6E178_9FIRM|nr:fumarate hydratase C-terminal domain-containing protein [Tissierella simiarum]MBU5436653.1 fumarate hydratase C-terminal domain-containing protein [Tissierella simiarum]
MKAINTPITEYMIENLSVGQIITVSGQILTGRDAVLPKLVALIENDKHKELGIELKGSVIFHTAVSPAGVGPTSSNKLDIERSIPELAKAGVKIHLGKGALKPSTLESLYKNNSVYAIIPPITALLSSKIIKKEIVAFGEEGMEALHLLTVKEFPMIIAAAHGKTLY